MAWIEVHKNEEYVNSIEWNDMEIPQTVVVDGETYYYDKYRGIYTDNPFKTKQEYSESIDDDVPF